MTGNKALWEDPRTIKGVYHSEDDMYHFNKTNSAIADMEGVNHPNISGGLNLLEENKPDKIHSLTISFQSGNKEGKFYSGLLPKKELLGYCENNRSPNSIRHNFKI